MTDRLEKIEKLSEKYHKQQDKADHAMRKAYHTHRKIEKLMQEEVHSLVPETNKNWLVYKFTGWVCESEENPLQMCIYDERDDPALDDCLFCHDPYERK